MAEIRRSSVEVGSLSTIVFGVSYIPGGDRRISDINSIDLILTSSLRSPTHAHPNDSEASGIAKVRDLNLLPQHDLA